MEGFKKLLALIAVGVTVLVIVAPEGLLQSACAQAEALDSLKSWVPNEPWVVDEDSVNELEARDAVTLCAASAGPESMSGAIMVPIFYQVETGTGRTTVITEDHPAFLELLILFSQ